MIVTCESCAARYKLDESKIAGRGAKITCPRCRHVFVVYKDEGAAASVSSAPAPAPSIPGSIPRPAASASLVDEPAAPAPAPAPADVHALDFRAVGIHTWKVKVKIGLVYDFSDFRTLAKYIGEGRVTATDKVSHDGKEWTDIGSLEALERHFIATYQRLEAEQAAAAAAAAAEAEADDEEEDFDDDEPTNIMGMGGEDPMAAASAAASAVSLASFSGSAAPRILPSGDAGMAVATAAALQAESGAAASPMVAPSPAPEESSRFVDPFEKRKRERGNKKRPAKRPAPAAPPPKTDGGSRSMVMGIAGIAIAGLAVWYLFLRTPDVVAPPPRVTAPAPAPDAAVDREKIKKDIMDELEPVPEPELEGGEEDTDPWGIEANAEPELRPVVPEHVRKAQARGGSPVPPPPASTGRATSAQDHVAVGDSAARSGDWNTAAAAYRKAVGMDPRNAVYNGKLGGALRRVGDVAGAMQALNTAAQGGLNTALRDLGDLSAEQGDTAGALGYYQRYLNTRPRDAAEVQRKIDRLNGG